MNTTKFTPVVLAFAAVVFAGCNKRFWVGDPPLQRMRKAHHESHNVVFEWKGSDGAEHTITRNRENELYVFKLEHQPHLQYKEQYRILPEGKCLRVSWEYRQQWRKGVGSSHYQQSKGYAHRQAEVSCELFEKTPAWDYINAYLSEHGAKPPVTRNQPMTTSHNPSPL